MKTKESMVLYESAYKAINFLPTVEEKWEAMSGLLEYGFYGVIPESDNPFINMVYVQAIPSMKSAKQRYFEAVENGKKGGRPTDVSTEEIVTLKESGLTNKQISEKTGLTEDAIKKRLQRNKGTKGTNLSVSVSEYESEYEYEYTSEHAPACEEESVNKGLSLRKLEDLSLVELKLVKQDYISRMPYNDIKAKYNLVEFIGKEFANNYESLCREKEIEGEQKDLFCPNPQMTSSSDDFVWGSVNTMEDDGWSN